MPSIADVVDPFRLCPDPDKKVRERQEYEDRLQEITELIANLRLKKNVFTAQANRVGEDIATQELHLRSICKHENLKTESMYYEGSYLDTAYTKRRNVCTVCGEASEWSKENHGWYG